MRKSRQALCFVIAVFMLLIVPFLASSALWAQEESLSLTSMKVSLWPEYDDPRLLVIYEGEFGDSATFPREVKFLIPRGSDINQVCAITKPGNEHRCQLYEVHEEGNWLAITYELPIPTFFLEYYYGGISGEADREAAYDFQSPYTIEELKFEVQQPLRSTDFTLSPAYTNVMSDGAGFKYYNFSIDSVAPDQVINVNASYSKVDQRPSVSGSQSQQNGPGGSGTAVILGIVGVAAIGGIGWIAVSRHRSYSPRAVRASSPGRKAKASMKEPQVARAGKELKKASFCAKCGLKLDQNDNFCSGCGEKAKGSG
jgi:hypothetical protein